MRALSIRQPYAELILRGIKPIEFRSRPTKIIGERFYIYASQQWAEGKLFLEGCRKPEARSQRSGVRSQEEGCADLGPPTSDF
jgi:predicted transcriptional regulator